MKVAFFLLHYPVFSETFVSKEILNLQNLGVNGLIVCEKQNHTPPFQPHIKDIKFPIIEISQKIFSSIFFKTIIAHFYWLFKNPLAYLKSLKIFFSFFNYHHFRVFIKSPLLAKNLVNQNLDLIYIHEVDSPCLYGLICSRLLNIPCGIIIHTQYLFAQNNFLTEKIKSADFIIFQSLYSKKYLQKFTHLSPNYYSKCHVLSTPGIDTVFFKPTKIKTDFKQIKLITIGRLEEAKGYPFLLQAIKLLKKSFPDIHLTIIGNGSQKPQLEKYVLKNHLEKNIHLLGFIAHGPKLIKLLHQHQYFILPSIIDSQGVHDVHPNVVKEAMSCGLIVITSKLGGITEIIKDKQNGFLISKITPRNIANVIISINQLSISQKVSVSKNAHQTILNFHQQQSVSLKLKEIFSKYLYE